MAHFLRIISAALMASLLLSDTGESGEKLIVKTLQDRGRLIRERLKTGYDPFLRECSDHLGKGGLSDGARHALETIALQTWQAWIQEEEEADIPLLLTRGGDLFSRIPSGASRGTALLDLARRLEPGDVAEDDLEWLLDLLGDVEGKEAADEVARLKGKERGATW